MSEMVSTFSCYRIFSRSRSLSFFKFLLTFFTDPYTLGCRHFIYRLFQINLDLDGGSAEQNESEGKEAVDTEERSVPTSSVGRFFDALMHPRIRYIRDFYPYIFFLDIISILIMAFNYPSFGELSSEQLSLLDVSLFTVLFTVLETSRALKFTM